MLSNKFVQLGDLSCSIYTFEKAGDELEKHVHGEEDVHITIVTNGKIKAYSHDWEKEASAGQILDFNPYEPHALLALEDNTKIVNIIKNLKKEQPNA